MPRAAAAESANLTPLSSKSFSQHYRTIRDAAREHEETAMALARAKKAAKKDGVDLAALKMIERFAKLETDEAETLMRHTMQYAAWLEMPIGTQPSMFPDADAPDDEVTSENRAYAAEEAGFEAGKAGKHRVDDNPYAAGTELYARFDKGYLRGQKTIADRLGKNAKAADPRRGRKAAAVPPVGKNGSARNGRSSRTGSPSPSML
jgi:hypothetical protein